jgi:hypothetical protein
MEELQFLDIFADAIPAPRQPVREIGIPASRGSGQCTKTGDNRYMIRTRNADFPQDLIDQNVMLVSADGQSINVKIEQAKREALVGQVIEFESECNPKQWGGVYVEVYSMSRLKVYKPENWLPENFTRYRIAMDAIGELDKLRDPKGEIVALLEVLEAHAGYWRDLMDDPSKAPEMGPQGQIVNEDEIIRQYGTWEKIDRAALALKEIALAENLYRPIDESEYMMKARPYLGISLCAGMGIARNAAMEAMTFPQLLRLWENFNLAISDVEPVVPEPPQAALPETSEGKKKLKRGADTLMKSDGLPSTSPESLEAELTPLTLVEA